MESICVLLAEPGLLLYFLNQRFYGIPLIKCLTGTVTHIKQLEKLLFFPGEAYIRNSAGFIRRILTAFHSLPYAGLAQFFRRLQDFVLYFFHILKQAENRLYGGSQFCPQSPRGYGGNAAFSRQLQCSLNNFLSGKLKLGRHFLSLLVRQHNKKSTLRNICYPLYSLSSESQWHSDF